jgi:hypothetical protein
MSQCLHSNRIPDLPAGAFIIPLERPDIYRDVHRRYTTGLNEDCDPITTSVVMKKTWKQSKDNNRET